jgi:hypothetical protein
MTRLMLSLMPPVPRSPRGAAVATLGAPESEQGEQARALWAERGKQTFAAERKGESSMP